MSELSYLLARLNVMAISIVYRLSRANGVGGENRVGDRVETESRDNGVGGEKRVGDRVETQDGGVGDS